MKAKALLQSFSNTCKIDSRCFQENKPIKKEENDSGRTKSADFPFFDIPHRKSIHRSRLIRARPIRKIRTTNEVFGAAEDGDRAVTPPP